MYFRRLVYFFGLFSCQYSAARWHLIYGHIQIVLTSSQKVDIVIPIRSGYWFKQYTTKLLEKCKPPGTLGYHLPRVF